MIPKEIIMKTNLTELVFILDRSGSMSGLETDTIGGYNSLLTKQQAEPGECRITTVLFDHQYELLHDRLDIQKIAPITSKDYFVRGNTALLDAIGRTIDYIGKALAQTKEAERPGKVLFVITTDGMENASSEYSIERVKQMIEHQQSTYSWEFLFLGANIDAVEIARSYGISASHAQTYHSDSVGTELNYNTLADTVAVFSKTGRIDEQWSTPILAYRKSKNDKPDKAT
jgi:uncharacterized protein YegL